MGRKYYYHIECKRCKTTSRHFLVCSSWVDFEDKVTKAFKYFYGRCDACKMHTRHELVGFYSPDGDYK